MADLIPDHAHVRCLDCGGIDTIISTQSIRIVGGVEEWECGETVGIEHTCENRECGNFLHASDFVEEVFVYVPDIRDR